MRQGRLVALALTLALLPGPAALAEAADLFRLTPAAISGCRGIAFPRLTRELLVEEDRAVDPTARFWVIDQPASYRDRASRTDYRIGSGVLRVETRIEEDLAAETVVVTVARPIEPEYLDVYLPGVALPCERETRYRVEAAGSSAADLAAIAEFDARLHASTELLYDGRFDAAERDLRRAMELRPDDAAPYWMMARLLYLKLEAGADGQPRAEHLEQYLEAERWADEAVRRRPLRSEGYLWQGIARGRIATSVGNLDIALRGFVGGRGPRWLDRTLHKAVSLQQEFRFFGFSTRGDALYALAQFYRLAPDDWYMNLVGTRGDLDRAIELAGEAVATQRTRIEYRKELAVALLCRDGPGDRDAAREQLEALLDTPAITPIDRIDQAHASALLRERPGNVCWYSRDGFLEAGL